MLLGEQLGLGAAEAHRAGTGILLHLAHHEEGDAEDEQEGQRLDEEVGPQRRLRLGLRLEGDALLAQALDELRVLRRRVGAERLVVGGAAGNDLLADHHLLDRAFLDLVQEFGIGDGIACGGRRSAHHLDEQDQGKDDRRPDQQALHPVVPRRVLVAVGCAVLVSHRVASRFRLKPRPRVAAGGRLCPFRRRVPGTRPSATPR
jgi:hypothetical protein